DSGIEAGNRVDWKLAVDFFETDQIVAIAGAIGEPLEADDAAQGGNLEGHSFVGRRHRPCLHRVEIEWRQAPSNDVDGSGSRSGAKMGRANQMAINERGTVSFAHALESDQCCEDASIILVVVGSEKVDVLGCPNEPIGDHRKAPDHYKSCACFG